MREMFNEMFWKIGEADGLTKWYEVFDSPAMDEVMELIAQKLGIIYNDDTDLFEVLMEVPEFDEWYTEMAEEL